MKKMISRRQFLAAAAAEGQAAETRAEAEFAADAEMETL